MIEADVLIMNATLLPWIRRCPSLKTASSASQETRFLISGRGAPSIHAKKVIDAQGGFVLPGLINAHTHASMSLLEAWRTTCPS
jgi:adenine deaminase